MSSLTDSLNTTLEHLSALVSFDSQNPPRAITSESEIFHYLKANLPGFKFEFIDAGDGCICLLAKRGVPKLLFNFHIDTVPVTQGWQSDPFSVVIKDEKVFGLGACDIKGAAACMLSAVAKTHGDVALLFSSDEEHGSSAAVKAFLKTDHGFNQVVVAEPTQAKAVLAHRGIQSAHAHFSGIAGHASEARAIEDNAIHKAANWISTALNWVNQQQFAFENLSGLPFNIGKIDGGIKANMIAAGCELSFGFRPLPGQDSGQILETLQRLKFISNDAFNGSIKITGKFKGPTLPAANQPFESAIEKSKSFAQGLKLPVGQAVNFWTEASLFSQAGLTAIVFGPGDIAQAHTANEWVALNQLKTVETHYIEILSSSNSTNDDK